MEDPLDISNIFLSAVPVIALFMAYNPATGIATAAAAAATVASAPVPSVPATLTNAGSASDAAPNINLPNLPTVNAAFRAINATLTESNGFKRATIPSPRRAKAPPGPTSSNILSTNPLMFSS